MDYKTILRHFLATLAYRTGVAIENVSDDYINFAPGNEAMTPKQIMLHMVQLLKVPDDIFNDRKYEPIELENWDDITKEFYTRLNTLDKTIEQMENLDEKKLLNMFQGPISDAMTHVGQLMTLHRLSGKPRQAKPYYKVDIQIGKFKYNYNNES